MVEAIPTRSAGKSLILNQSAVLVAEDETFIALDIAFAIEDAGGMVVGPVSTVREALTLLEQQPVAAAILDVNLIDGDISPVVELSVVRTFGTTRVVN